MSNDRNYKHTYFFPLVRLFYDSQQLNYIALIGKIDEWERIWKELLVVLSQPLPGGTE
jgi:hypothetical protein